MLLWKKTSVGQSGKSPNCSSWEVPSKHNFSALLLNENPRITWHSKKTSNIKIFKSSTEESRTIQKDIENFKEAIINILGEKREDIASME